MTRYVQMFPVHEDFLNDKKFLVNFTAKMVGRTLKTAPIGVIAGIDATLEEEIIGHTYEADGEVFYVPPGTQLRVVLTLE